MGIGKIRMELVFYNTPIISVQFSSIQYFYYLTIKTLLYCPCHDHLCWLAVVTPEALTSLYSTRATLLNCALECAVSLHLYSNM